jgi:hypothetical protein
MLTTKPEQVCLVWQAFTNSSFWAKMCQIRRLLFEGFEFDGDGYFFAVADDR